MWARLWVKRQFSLRLLVAVRRLGFEPRLSVRGTLIPSLQLHPLRLGRSLGLCASLFLLSLAHARLFFVFLSGHEHVSK